MIHIIKYFIILLGLGLFMPGQLAKAEIIEEMGSLRGFLAGSCPGCGYDNLISHMTEGIARDNYNIYNPLDPQTEGFGHYEEIPNDSAGASLLSTWKDLFRLLIQHEWVSADSFLQENLQDYPFELVYLRDSALNREYYILRELLNPEYVDLNDTLNLLDNEVGSFDFSWGVYVYAVDAVYPRITVQVVHPNDDYIAPYVAIDMFETLDAGQLFFTTAGREVAWRGGIYTNTASLSDPSRNGQHVFQMAHEAATDHFIDEVAEVNPLMIQVHSYDTRNRTFPSAIVTASYWDRRINLPVYDWSGVLGGMIDRTDWIAVPEGTIGNEEPVYTTQFYASWSLDRLVVRDDNGFYHNISNANDLLGYTQSNQLNYRSDEIDRCRDHEWLIHIECDELPNCIEDSTEYDFYRGAGYPVDWDNFEAIVQYYHPMSENLRASLDTIEVYVDEEFSNPPSQFRLSAVSENRVILDWMSADDPYFESYRIYYDTIPEVNLASPFRDANDIEGLCWPLTHSTAMTNLLYDQDYFFAMTAIDQFGHETELTEVVSAHTENTPRVVVPNGGEFWDYHGTQLVVWAGEFEDRLTIELNRDYPHGEWELLAEELDDDGQEEIALSEPLSDNCRIRIRNVLTDIEAVSQADFRIGSQFGYLQLVNVEDDNNPVFEWSIDSLECPDSAELRFQVMNRGYSPILVVGPYLVDGEVFGFTNDCLLQEILQPESTAICTMRISFNEVEAALYRDTLRIPTTAVNATNNELPIPLEIKRTLTVEPPEIVLQREENSIRISWIPVSESIQEWPVNPLYRVWYYEDKWANRYYLGDTADTTYVHDGVLNRENKMFYEVHVVDIE